MTAFIAFGSMTLAIAPPSREPTLRIGEPGPSDELQKWIARNAVTIRSIDAADEDFTDLEPLIEAIGSARVVQLGEPSHGAGSSFAAKVRLIKFLHQRMGFDVLVWESGLHGLRLVEAGMRARDDAVAAAQRGIFTIWSNTEEVKPLFDYAKASQSTRRPLEMAGFDMQFTAAKSFERFAVDLRSFVGAIYDPVLRRRSQDLVERAVGAYERICCARDDARSRKYAELARSGKTGTILEQAMAAWDKTDGPRFQPKQDDLNDLHDALDRLLQTIGDHRQSFEQVHGAKETSFMEHAIENMRGDGTGKFDIVEGAAGTTAATFRNVDAYFNRRDAQNARNLRWLLETGYPGRKVIVWAHNAHVMHAYFGSRFRDVHLEPRPGDMKPTGVYLADWLGDEVYTIGVTTYEGQDGWATSDIVTPVPSAMAGSLESRLHALGKRYVFLDFRTLDTTPGHPLRKPHPVRILIPVHGSKTAPPGNGNYIVSDVTRVFDALLYIDRMAPATRILEHGGPG